MFLLWFPLLQSLKPLFYWHLNSIIRVRKHRDIWFLLVLLPSVLTLKFFFFKFGWRRGSGLFYLIKLRRFEAQWLDFFARFVWFPWRLELKSLSTPEFDCLIFLIGGVFVDLLFDEFLLLQHKFSFCDDGAMLSVLGGISDDSIIVSLLIWLDWDGRLDYKFGYLSKTDVH